MALIMPEAFFRITKPSSKKNLPLTASPLPLAGEGKPNASCCGISPLPLAGEGQGVRVKKQLCISPGATRLAQPRRRKGMLSYAVSQ